MTSRYKVWCALGVALLVNLFANGLAQAATYPVNCSTTWSPNALPFLIPGDTVQFKIGKQQHLTLDYAPMFGGEFLLPGYERYYTFNSAGTFIVRSDVGPYGYCIITVTQPINAAPSITWNTPTNHAVIAVTNSSGVTNLALRSTASDEDGSVNRVQFFYGVGTNTAGVTNLIGTFTNSANTNNTTFNFVWTNARPGRYLLRSRAYDNKEVFANSQPINLSLYTPFTNSLPAVTNVSSVKNLVFRFNTDTGLVYAVEVSTNLTNWSAILTNTATNSIIQVLDPNLSTLTNRFYRIRLIP